MNKEILSSLLKPSEVAEKLGVQEKTLAQWRSNKTLNLPYCKIGSLVRYRREDVEVFVQTSLQPGSCQETNYAVGGARVDL